MRRSCTEICPRSCAKALTWAVFQGAGANQQPSAFATVLTGGRTAALTKKASFSALLLRVVEMQETARLLDPARVRIAGAPLLMQTLADMLVTSTAVSELDRLKSAGFSPLFSSQVSAQGARDASGKRASTDTFGAGDGNAFVPTWGSPELIVGP